MMRRDKKELSPRNNRAGFSLLEITLASVIVSITLVASLNSLAFVTATGVSESNSHVAARLAQVLFAEIASQPFLDPDTGAVGIGLESGEDAAQRSSWDDCDDYHSWTSSSLQTINGDTIPGSQGWSSQVDVVFCDVNNPNQDAGNTSQLKRITLTLTSPSNQTFIFHTLRSQDGVLQHARGTSAQALAHVSVFSSGDGRTNVAATRLVNAQEPQ